MKLNFSFAAFFIFGITFICMTGCSFEKAIDEAQNNSAVVITDVESIEVKRNSFLIEPSLRCGDVMGLSEIMQQGLPKYFLIGEFHGIIEFNKMVTSISCVIAEVTDLNVLVLLELDSYGDDLFDNLKESNSKDRRSLVKESLYNFWSTNKDGRGSQGRLQMILDLANLGDDLPISLGSLGATYEDFEKIVTGEVPNYMLYTYEAESILKQGKDFDYVIVLAGNWHTARFAHLFNKAGEKDFVVFDPVLGSGTAWACMVGECKEHEIKPMNSLSDYPNYEKYGLDIVGETAISQEGRVIIRYPTASPPVGK